MSISNPASDSLARGQSDTDLGVSSEDYSILSSDLVRGRLTSLRILVVDDVGFDLEFTKQKLSVLEERLAGEIVGTTDSEQAIKLIIQAAEEGRPFDVVISDCQMKSYRTDPPSGVNGDEMLKLAAKSAQNEGFLLPPIVYHSGSHASGIQSFLWKEIELARRMGETLADLEADICIGELPLTLVDKKVPAVGLVEAVNQVLRVSERGKTQQYQKYVASDKFQISTLETSYDDHLVAQFARIFNLATATAQSFLDIANDVIFSNKKFDKTRSDLASNLERASSARFSFEA